MSDEEIIALYFARDEQALAQTDAKYGPYCFSLANAILPSREDAEEALNDTYLKAWQSMPPKKPAVLRLFLAKISTVHGFGGDLLREYAYRLDMRSDSKGLCGHQDWL